MKHSSRRILALLLALSLCIGMMPMSIFADEGTQAEPDAEPSAVENVLDAEEGEKGDSAVPDTPAAPAAGEEAGEETKTEEPAADETKKVDEPLVEVKEEAAPVADEKKTEESDEELKLDEAKILDVQEGAKLEVLEKAPAEDAEQKGEMLEKAPAEEKKIDDSADDVNSEEEPAPAVEVAVKAVKAVAGYNGYYASFHYDYTANDGTVYSYVYPNYHDDGGSLGMTIPDDGHVSPPSFSFISRRLQSKGFPIQEEGAYIIAWKHGTDGYQAGTYNIDDNNFDFKGMSCTIFRQNHFFAVWAKSSDDVVVVTFDPGFEGGDAPVSQSIIPGENAKVKQPSNFPSGYLYYNTNHTNTYVYNGQKYYFDYWTLNGEKYDFNTVIKAGTDDFTLVAKWHKRCDITFVTNVEGVTVDPKVVDEGKTITQPSVKNPGHELKYWYYLDGEDKVVFDFENTAVTENLTLYAEWRDVDTVKYCMVSPSGFASGESYTVTYSEAENAEEFAAGKFTVASFEETGFKAPKGWKFLGWKEVDKDPSAVQIEPGTGGGTVYDDVKKKPALSAAANLRFRSRLADEEAELMKEQEAEQSQAQEVDDGEEPAAVSADPIQPGTERDLHAEVYLVPVWGKTPLVIYNTNYPTDALKRRLGEASAVYNEYKLEDEQFLVKTFDEAFSILDEKKEVPEGYKFAGWIVRFSDSQDPDDEGEQLQPGTVVPFNPGEHLVEDREQETLRRSVEKKAYVPAEAVSEAMPAAEAAAVLQKLEQVNPGEMYDIHLRVYLDAIWEPIPGINYHTNYPVDRLDKELKDSSVFVNPFKDLDEDQDMPEEFVILALDDEELKFAVPDGYEFDGWYIVYNDPLADLAEQELLPSHAEQAELEHLPEYVQNMDAVEYVKEEVAAKSVKKAALRSGEEAEMAQPGQSELVLVDVEKEPSGASDRLYQPEETYKLYRRVDIYAIWLMKPTVTYHTYYRGLEEKVELEEASYVDSNENYSAKMILEYSKDEDNKPITVLGFDEIGPDNGFVEPEGYMFDHWFMKYDDRDPRAESPVNPKFYTADNSAVKDDEAYMEKDYEEVAEEDEESKEEVVMDAKAVEAKAEKRETLVMKAAKASIPEEAIKESAKESTVFPAEEAESSVAVATEVVTADTSDKEEDPDIAHPGDSRHLHLRVDFLAFYVPANEVEYNSNYPEALSLAVQTARDKIKKDKNDVVYNVLSLDEVTKINSEFVAPTGYKFLGWSLDDPDQTEKLLNAPKDTITIPGEKPTDVKPTDGKDSFDPGSVKPIDWSNMSNKIDAQPLPSADLVSSNGTSEKSEAIEAMPAALMEAEVKESVVSEAAAVRDEKEKDTVDPPESGTIPPEQEQDPGQQAEASNVKPEHIFYAQWEKVWGVYWIDEGGSIDNPLTTGTYDEYDSDDFDPEAQYKENGGPSRVKEDKVFDHWELKEVDEDGKTAVYEAVYKPVDPEKTYTATWVDEDGKTPIEGYDPVTFTDPDNPPAGDKYGDGPAKDGYTFTGWEKIDEKDADGNPTGNIIYQATYAPANNPTAPSNPRPTTPATTEDPVEEEPSEIDENDTPLSGFEVDPEEDAEEVSNNETPLAGFEVEPEEDDEIAEEATPLSPFTGDDRNTVVWGIVSILSLLGIVLVARKRKEE